MEFITISLFAANSRIPEADTIPVAQFEFTGPIGERVRRNVDNWLLRAPQANPGMLEMFRLPGARLDFRFVQILQVSLLPVMRNGADGRNVESKRGFEIRGVVEAADERVDRDVDRAFDVAVATQ